MDFRINHHDIVGLVHCAWEHSFARAESSRRAIADRGWNPLTFNLLDHEELHSAINNVYQLTAIHGKESIDPSSLNFDRGVAKTLMNQIIEQKI